MKHFLTVLFCFTLYSVLKAQNEYVLDSTFAQNGIFKGRIAILLDADATQTMLLDTQNQYRLLRLQGNGTPDESWGPGGYRPIETNFPFKLRDIKKDNQGRWIVVGCERRGNTFVRAVAFRLRSDTRLDTTFGQRGFFWGDTAVVRCYEGVHIGQSDYTFFTASGARGQWFWEKHVENGSLDPLFGEKGRLKVETPQGASIPSTIPAIAQAPDGTIWIHQRNYRFVFSNFSGEYDEVSAFTRQGVHITGFYGYSYPRRIRHFSLTPEGILLIIHSTGMTDLAGITKLLPDGNVDVTFSTNATAMKFNLSGNYYTFPSFSTLDGQGRITVSGYVFAGSPDNARAFVRRFLPSGQTDVSFGVNGVLFLRPDRSDTLHYYYNTQHIQLADGSIALRGNFQNHRTNRRQDYLARLAGNKLTVSEDEPSTSAFAPKAHPQPVCAGQTLYLTGDADYSTWTYQLCHLSGTVVAMGRLNQSSFVVPDCPTGLYLLRMNNGRQVQTLRVLIR